MAERKPVVLVSGQLKELPTGDTLPPQAPAAHSHATSDVTGLDAALAGKQAVLVSGTNLKTAGGQSLVGSGNAPIVAPETHAASSKATPVDDDELGIVDSAASNALKKLTWANLKATLLAYFKGQFREKLTADRAYYVRTDGSDSNNGLANTSGGAFLTIQKAVDMAAGLDLGIYDVTIYVGAGTWTVSNTLKTLIGAGQVVIRGINADISSTIISVTGAACFSGTYVGQYKLDWLKLQTITAGRCLEAIGGGAVLRFDHIDFGPAAQSHLYAAAGGYIDGRLATYTISGATPAHIGAFDCAHLRISLANVTITGTPEISTFATAGRCASVLVVGTTFTGSSTGSRYSADTNAVILVNGAGETFLPGNSAGVKTNGGQYA